MRENRVNERDERKEERKKETNAEMCARRGRGRKKERECKKCDYGVVTCGGRKSFLVLIASGRDVLVARIVHSRVYER